MSFPVDTRTPCYGKGHLFDSRDPHVHAETKKMCDACPAALQCRALLEQTMRDYPGGPEGTWAGQHINPLGKQGRPRKVAAAEGHRCGRCGTTYDLGHVEVIARYADCSVWKCPGCGVTSDDRVGAA